MSDPSISISYRLQSAIVAILSTVLMIFLLIHFKGSSSAQAIVFLLFIGSSMFFTHKTASLAKAIDEFNMSIIQKLNEKYSRQMIDHADDLRLILQSFSPEERVALQKSLMAVRQSRALLTLHVVMHLVGLAVGIYVLNFYIG